MTGSDSTDVYRVQYRYNDDGEWSGWLPCGSRAHQNGLYVNLASAKRAARQQPHEYDYRIQKLRVAVTEASKYFHIDVSLAQLQWIDIDE